MLITNKKIVIGYEEQKNNNITTSKKFFVNQCGYDIDKSKRATFANGKRGSKFYLKKTEDDSIVYEGRIYNQIADFSKYELEGEYYLECEGIKSYNFKIGNKRLQDVSLSNSLLFMEMARQDAFDVGGSSGYAWRDGHQFSFELNTLVMQYMSNPSYYESLPRNVYKVDKCEYPELRTQNEPNIIWLIKFGVTRYYKWATEKGVKLHAFIKGQLAYFLYLYPHITQYITQEFYETIRDFTISVWSVDTCNKAWYEECVTHNLFITESVVGTVKGACPPGYSIVPNLLMYEVLKRDGLDGYQDYFDAAYNSCKWIVESVDLDDPTSTKGQRMNEYITVTSLTYFQEMYSTTCPTGLLDKIKRLGDVYISRSDNLWDYRQYRKNGDITGATKTTWVNDYTGSGGLANQPGNIAGLMACCYSIARVITDKNKIKRLKQIAVSSLDHCYGRNPCGRHFCYKAAEEFDGAIVGWVERYQGGLGNLGYVVGVLDGSPKESSYPYNKDASTGYTEGWVAFNTAWNMSLAYLCAENNEINKIGIFN